MLLIESFIKNIFQRKGAQDAKAQREVKEIEFSQKIIEEPV
jgi:hypothetical protein